MFSIETLEGALDEKEDLKHEFQQRGYSVRSLVNGEFSRDDVLAKIAELLQDAEAGDVRAIVYTGHAWCEEGGPVMLVPPQCPCIKGAILEADWEANIRKHAKPGVIVFSILAHCFGDFMTQDFNLRQWHDTVPRNQANSDAPGPIFVTFSATSSGMSAYESRLGPGSSRVTDHFIHALVSTMRSTGVHDWETFFRIFQGKFESTRAAASQGSFDKIPGEGWRAGNPQVPCFSTSEGVVSAFHPCAFNITH
jgi:hypothetical protein